MKLCIDCKYCRVVTVAEGRLICEHEWAKVIATNPVDGLVNPALISCEWLRGNALIGMLAGELADRLLRQTSLNPNNFCNFTGRWWEAK
jgi:hypothetical protein